MADRGKGCSWALPGCVWACSHFPRVRVWGVWLCEVLAAPFDCSSQIYSCLCYCGYLFGLRNCNLNVFNVILRVRPDCLHCLRCFLCLFYLLYSLSLLSVSCYWLWFQFRLTVNCLLAPDVRLIVEPHRGAGAGQLIGA